MEDFNAEYYTNSGIDKTNKGEYISALEDFNKSIKIRPNWELTYFSKGIVFHKLNRLEEAYENYTKAIEINKKMTDAYYNRAQTILAAENNTAEDLKKALTDLEEAVKLDNKFIDAMYYSAVVKMKLNDYQGAIDLLDKIIKIEPNAIHSRALKKLIIKKYL